MTKINLAFVFCFFAFLHANAQHNHAQHQGASASQTTVKAKPAAGQLAELFTHYTGIKDALVAGDQAGASGHANALSQAASLISYRDLSEGNINALRKDASDIADAKDLGAQRRTFSNLSYNISALAGQFKLSDKPVYQQYCPMAKAYWLSNEKEIRNPYYGSAMLSCGSVKNTF